MATLTVEITDATKQLVDEQVATGRFKDAGALIETLLTRATWLHNNAAADGFSDEEKKRIDQMLLKADAEFERGEYTVHKPGDIRRMFDQLKRQSKDVTSR